MSPPGNAGQRDGVVFTQNITAADDGQVNAVQDGDLYVYVYRYDPPYRVEPFAPSAPAPVSAALARVPSRLLAARHRVVPYRPHPELAQLEAWRDDRSPGLSVRLVYAEGGQGKTRLAGEFAARCAQAGWAVAFARHRSEVASAGGGDEHLTVRAPGLVLIVDYAERWPRRDLITLVSQHQTAVRDRLRILLLARSAGMWWDDLDHQFGKLDIKDAKALPLRALPDDPTVRAAMYTTARDRFAEIFAVIEPDRIKPPTHLRDRVFSLTLTVHMRALVDVDAASRGQAPPTGSDQARLSSYLLAREHDYWLSSHDDGYGPVRTGSLTMGRTVYVATLTHPLTRTDAEMALARARVADTASACALILEDHARCYPPEDPSLVLEPLYPDRLGEDYLALTLPGREEEFDYHATDKWTKTAPTLLLATAGQETEPAVYTRQALSVMIEAAHRWPHLATEHLDPLLRRFPSLALFAGSTALIRLADLATLDIAALEAIESQIPDHRHVDLDLGAAALTARLTDHRLATTTDPATRANLYTTLAWRYDNAGLYQEALDAAQHVTELYRALTKDNSTAYQSDLAMALNNLGLLLSKLGRQDQALAAALEAVRIHRALMQNQPTAHRPDLATTLTNLANLLSKLGRQDQALAAALEAVRIHRALTQNQPTAHRPDLAGSLNSVSLLLSAAGRQQDALAPARETVELYRELAKDNPDTYRPDLTGSLNNLGILLAQIGQRQEAVATGREVAQIYRALAEVNPTAYLPDHAMALNNLGNLLSDVGELGEALDPAREAVAIRRTLAEVNPAAYQPDLAGSLTNLGNVLSQLGELGKALDPAREAVELYRALAKGNPTAYNPDFAASLTNLGDLLSQVEMGWEALVCTRQATDLFRALAKANPAAYQPNLAKALINLGADLLNTGQREGALAPTTEAMTILRRMAETDPTAYRPDLAKVLMNLGALLSMLGRHKKALIPAQEAVQLYLRLETSDALMRDLALAMDNLAATLSGLGRRKESAAMVQKAAAIRRFLEVSQVRPTR